MDRRRLLTALLLGMAVIPTFSCRALMEYKPPKSSGNNELLQTNVGPDTVTFDILIIHVPHQQQAIPEPLSRLMEIKGRGLRESLEEEVPLEKNHGSSLTLSKIQTLQPGKIAVIPTLDQPVDRIPVLTSAGGSFAAELYRNAMTSLSVAAEPLPDGSVSFELTPFLTFGDAAPVTKYQYGQLIRTTEQPTKTFDELRGNFPLRPGQFLVIGPSDKYVAGLGRYFFTQGIGDYDSKIVVIRLLFTQHDKLFHQFPGFQEVYEKGKDGNLVTVGTDRAEKSAPPAAKDEQDEE